MQKLLILLVGLVILASCATQKPLPEPPAFDISGVSTAAPGIDTVALCGEISVRNASSVSCTVGPGTLRLSLDARDAGAVALEGFELAPGAEKRLPFRFEAKVVPGSADECAWSLCAISSARFGKCEAPLKAVAQGTFPRIREPLFRIDAIKIQKADLVNTKLEVSLHIENPNAFPVSFDALDYELFGEGKYWAEGKAAAGLSVGSREELDTKVILVMDFIDMGRPLLNQVIRLEEVRYRFKGTGIVGTGLPFLPRFTMRFDDQGISAVSE